MNNYHNPANLHPEIPSSRVKGQSSHPQTRRNATIFQHLVHVPTLLALEDAGSVPWPRPGKLSIHFSLLTPLYCELAQNGQEVKESEIASREGLRDDVVLAVCGVSLEGVRWKLNPVSEGPNLQGFFPEVESIVPLTYSSPAMREPLD